MSQFHSYYSNSGRISHYILIYFHLLIFRSVQECVGRCRDLYFRYVGLKAGHTCLCGNGYNRLGISTTCGTSSVTCTGDQGDVCGASSAIRAFEIYNSSWNNGLGGWIICFISGFCNKLNCSITNRLV